MPPRTTRDKCRRVALQAQSSSTTAPCGTDMGLTRRGSRGENRQKHRLTGMTHGRLWTDILVHGTLGRTKPNQYSGRRKPRMDTNGHESEDYPFPFEFWIPEIQNHSDSKLCDFVFFISVHSWFNPAFFSIRSVHNLICYRLDEGFGFGIRGDGRRAVSV